jgi:hypothetical protein
MKTNHHRRRNAATPTYYLGRSADTWTIALGRRGRRAVAPNA